MGVVDRVIAWITAKIIVVQIMKDRPDWPEARAQQLASRLARMAVQMMKSGIDSKEVAEAVRAEVRNA